ncbi:hypothetical protein P9X50_28200, partial [Bacillus cereus]|nr:hypothetical protein [Bacillus cereus]
PLIDAIHFLKEVFMKRKTLLKYDIEDIPQTCIQNGAKRYLYTKDDVHSKRLLIDRILESINKDAILTSLTREAPLEK